MPTPKRSGGSPEGKRKRFYVNQRNWTIAVLTDPRLTHADKTIAVLWVQKHVSKIDDCAHVSYAKLGATAGTSSKTAQRAIRKLCEFGYMTKVGYRGRTRIHQAIWIDTSDDDAGHVCPPGTGNTEADHGQNNTSERTPVSGQNGQQCPTNHKIEPNEPEKGTTEQGSMVKGDGCSQSRPDAAMDFGSRLLREKWERKLRESDPQISQALIILTEHQVIDVVRRLEHAEISPNGACILLRNMAATVVDRRMSLSSFRGNIGPAQLR